MELLTQQQREKLLENGRNPDIDHWPVARLNDLRNTDCFLVVALAEIEDEGDVLMGLAISGGNVELACYGLQHLIDTRAQRDDTFEPKYPISVYLKAARLAGHINNCSDDLLRDFAAKQQSDDMAHELTAAMRLQDMRDQVSKDPLFKLLEPLSREFPDARYTVRHRKSGTILWQSGGEDQQ